MDANARPNANAFAQAQAQFNANADVNASSVNHMTAFFPAGGGSQQHQMMQSQAYPAAGATGTAPPLPMSQMQMQMQIPFNPSSHPGISTYWQQQPAPWQQHQLQYGQNQNQNQNHQHQHQQDLAALRYQASMGHQMAQPSGMGMHVPQRQQWVPPVQIQLPPAAQTSMQAGSSAWSLPAGEFAIAPGPASVRAYSPEEKERVLVDALRRGTTEGRTARQVVEKLQRRAAGVDWTSYLLDNLERIAKKAYRLSSSGENALPASPASSSSAPPSEPSPISPVVHKRAVPPRPQVQVVIPKKTKPVPNVQRKPPTIPKPLSRLRTSQKAAAARKRSSIRRDAVASSQSTGRTSNSRLARCGPVEQYHAYTYIPYLPPDMKPDPPRRDPDDADPRFTDDDKVFFIHYLQWRLHKGAVPKKEALYAELAEQTPHHSAESWKRHWADVPELPDQIYIAARKREKEGGNAKRPPSSEHKRSDDSESESESESEDERSYVESEEESDAQSDQSKGAGENLGQSQSTSPVSAPNPRRQPPKPPKPRMKVPGLKVTEEDLRKMARYMVEKHAVWGQTSSTQGRWREFADRPENRSLRSLAGWSGIARHHASELGAYFHEYMAEREGARQNPKAHTPPQHDSPAAVSPATENAVRTGTSEDAMHWAGKRPSEDEHSVVAEKRAKLDPDS